MADFSDFIGRLKIYREQRTEKFYGLEKELVQCTYRAADEMRNLFGNEIPEDELRAFCIGDVLFTLLDNLRPESIPAAEALLRFYAPPAIKSEG